MLQKRQERQAENGEMIALDRLEQMDAASLQLIGADAGRHAGARRVEIGLEEIIGKIAHREPRDRHMAERQAAIATYRDRGMQFVRLAAHETELVARRRAIRRL